MKNIEKFEKFNTLNENRNNDITVGKLIDMLSKFDPEYPVRMSFIGYHNQEIIGVTEEDEWDSKHEKLYPIVSINGQ